MGKTVLVFEVLVFVLLGVPLSIGQHAVSSGVLALPVAVTACGGVLSALGSVGVGVTSTSTSTPTTAQQQQHQHQFQHTDLLGYACLAGGMLLRAGYQATLQHAFRKDSGLDMLQTLVGGEVGMTLLSFA